MWPGSFGKELTHESREIHRKWGYALAWCVVYDRIKLWAYKMFDKEGGLLNHLMGRHAHLTDMK
jgi:hypothetical protein